MPYNNRSKKNLMPFKKGQSGNPKGQPKKRFKEHIADIKAMGYVAPTRSEYFEMIGLLLSMDEADIAEFQEDKGRPYWVRLILKDLNGSANRQKMMADYRDWLYGKAKQSVDVTGKVDVKQITGMVIK